jgi:hypothetical protein
MGTQWLTYAEAFSDYGLSPGQLRNLARSGKVRVRIDNRTSRFSEEDLDRATRSLRSQTGPEHYFNGDHLKDVTPSDGPQTENETAMRVLVNLGTAPAEAQAAIPRDEPPEWVDYSYLWGRWFIKRGALDGWVYGKQVRVNNDFPGGTRYNWPDVERALALSVAGELKVLAPGHGFNSERSKQRENGGRP